MGLSLYYEATSRPSRVGDAPLHLHANDIANTIAPVATVAKEKDSAAVKFARRKSLEEHRRLAPIVPGPSR